MNANTKMKFIIVKTISVPIGLLLVLEYDLSSKHDPFILLEHQVFKLGQLFEINEVQLSGLFQI